jgi:processing peptidase subunit alpha
MYSRLYTDVLNRYGWVESCEAFVTSYADIGLFGLYSQADFSSANDMMRVAVAQLINMQHVGEVELARARNMLKTSIFYALETRNVQYDDIGRQVRGVIGRPF